MLRFQKVMQMLSHDKILFHMGLRGIWYYFPYLWNYRSKHKWTRKWFEFISTKRHLFRVGFHEKIILVHKNLDLDNRMADWLMIWSEFIWTIFGRIKNEGMNLPEWTRTKSSTSQRPDYRGLSSYRPRLLLHENLLEINAFSSIWTRTIFEFIYALICFEILMTYWEWWCVS